MGLKHLVICTENDQVLFTGTSQSETAAPSKSGTFVVGEHPSASEERLAALNAPTLPAPALIEDEADVDAYCDDAPTILRAPSSRRQG